MNSETFGKGLNLIRSMVTLPDKHAQVPKSPDEASFPRKLNVTPKSKKPVGENS